MDCSYHDHWWKHIYHTNGPYFLSPGLRVNNIKFVCVTLRSKLDKSSVAYSSWRFLIIQLNKVCGSLVDAKSHIGPKCFCYVKKASVYGLIKLWNVSQWSSQIFCFKFCNTLFVSHARIDMVSGGNFKELFYTYWFLCFCQFFIPFIQRTPMVLFCDLVSPWFWNTKVPSFLYLNVYQSAPNLVHMFIDTILWTSFFFKIWFIFLF